MKIFRKSRILKQSTSNLKDRINISAFIAIFLLINTTVVKAEDVAMLNNPAGSRIQDVSDSVSGSTSISATIFNDANDNLIQDINENGISGIHVQLFDKKGKEINVGSDGILGNFDDSVGGVITDENGQYHFYNVTQSFYRIRVTSE